MITINKHNIVGQTLHFEVSLCSFTMYSGGVSQYKTWSQICLFEFHLIIIDLCYQVQQVGLMKKDHTKFPPETVFWQKTSPKQSSYLTYIEISFKIKLRPWGPPGGLVKSLPTNLISLDVVLRRR